VSLITRNNLDRKIL